MKEYSHIPWFGWVRGAGLQCEPVVWDSEISKWLKCQANQDQIRTEEPYWDPECEMIKLSR